MAARSLHVAVPKAASVFPHNTPTGTLRAVKTASKDMTLKLGMLKKRSEFLYVRDGLYSAKGGVVVQMRKNQARRGVGIGFTATKKIGNAVIRNRAKRRLREAARALLPELGLRGHDYVLIARNATTAREWPDLLDDTRKALITLSKRATEPTGRPHTSAQRQKAKSQT